MEPIRAAGKEFSSGHAELAVSGCIQMRPPNVMTTTDNMQQKNIMFPSHGSSPSLVLIPLVSQPRYEGGTVVILI